MLSLAIVLALLAGIHLVTAQLGSRASTCPTAVPYTASAITRTFDYCIPAYAYGATFTAVASPYPTNQAACANSCTGSCVAANWAAPNNCQLVLGSFQFLSTFATWNPTWTAYVVRAIPTPTITIPQLPILTAISFLSPITPSPSQSTATVATCSPNANYFDNINCADGCQCYSKFVSAGLPVCMASFDYSKPCQTDGQCLQYGSFFPLCLTASFTGTSGTGYCSSNNDTDYYGSRNVACARGRLGSLVTPITPQVISTSSVTPVIGLSILPSPEPASLVCPNSNATNYTDPIGTQFSVQCGFDLYDVDPELRTVQPSFQACIDDCSRRFAGKCPGVTYNSTRQWCYMKPATANLRPAAAALWSAVKLPGPEGLTCPEANGTIYTDGVYTDQLRDQYQISCGVELVDSGLTQRSVQLSFQACINDCHQYDDCSGVTWRPNGQDQRWCYRNSRNAVARRAGPTYWSAQKVYSDIIPSVITPALSVITSSIRTQ